jgi:hypothetical protein
MATKKKVTKNNAKAKATKTTRKQKTADTLPGGIKKEDLLDMTKGAANMERLHLPIEGIEGKTIGGAGSGPGTGDTGGDFDRPGTEGLPAINDFVDPAGLNETSDRRIPAGGETTVDPADLPAGGTSDGSEASGFPGGGAVRTAEDRLPPGKVDEDAGFSPESPLNR